MINNSEKGIMHQRQSEEDFGQLIKGGTGIIQYRILRGLTGDRVRWGARRNWSQENTVGFWIC